MANKCPKCDTDNPSDSKFCKECATPLPSPEEISPTKTLETPKEEFTRGTTFAERYDFIEELGKGGMGSVYKVFDKKIKEEVALKILKPEIADELKEMIQEGMNKKDMRLYYHLVGNIELEKENYTKAIEYFKEAIALLPFQHDQFDAQALFFDPLALAYYKAGYLEKAKAEYEKIISLSVGRLFWGDKYAKSFYMLGKIYEEKGWKGKAIEHYEKFLDLWKDADLRIAEARTLTEDAKKKLAGLTSN